MLSVCQMRPWPWLRHFWRDVGIQTELERHKSAFNCQIDAAYRPTMHSIRWLLPVSGSHTLTFVPSGSLDTENRNYKYKLTVYICFFIHSGCVVSSSETDCAVCRGKVTQQLPAVWSQRHLVSHAHNSATAWGCSRLQLHPRFLLIGDQSCLSTQQNLTRNPEEKRRGLVGAGFNQEFFSLVTRGFLQHLITQLEKPLSIFTEQTTADMICLY